MVAKTRILLLSECFLLLVLAYMIGLKLVALYRTVLMGMGIAVLFLVSEEKALVFIPLSMMLIRAGQV